jgi:FMN phosphatase YigB (HAD superfamily)
VRTALLRAGSRRPRIGRGQTARVRSVRHPGRAYEAITFDFWNTLMWEEPGSLRESRLAVWADALERVNARVESIELLEHAHDAAHETYVESWKAGRQFCFEDAAEHILESLDGDRREDVLRVIVDGFEEGGRQAAVHPSHGVRECLEALERADVRVGIVCDIGLTPSPVVCELLDRHDLLGFFDGTSFSDEVGSYKPDPVIFEHALATLGGVAPDRAAHVGDRRRTDVAGAIAMGMTAVLYNGVFEDFALQAPQADIVISDLAELPRVLRIAD